MVINSEKCEDGSCGAGADWPNCSTDCVCACHDAATERLLEAADKLAEAALSSKGYVNAAKNYMELKTKLGT